MDWNTHSNLPGAHSFLSPSNYHWLYYEDTKLMDAWNNYDAAERGTRLHAFAAECIKLGQKLPRSTKTLNSYVNDAIGFGMSPEILLYYSDNCYGTADAISFRDGTLRIHDLKTGETPAHMEQLMIYAALFCMEYKQEPVKINTELRIYQSDAIQVYKLEGADIIEISNRIIHCNKILEDLKGAKR